MTYKTIDGALKAAKYGINLDNIISGRFYHNTKGWTKLVIKDIKLDDLLSTIGGRKDYSLMLRRYIAGGYSHGIMSRFMFNDYGWHYCAGQDYTAELNTIRQLLRGV